jgi:hypothetical protein
MNDLRTNKHQERNQNKLVICIVIALEMYLMLIIISVCGIGIEILKFTYMQFVVPELGTCLSSGLRWLSSGPRQVSNSVDSVLDWDNKNCLSSGPRQSDYLSSGLRQHKNYLSSGPRQLDCLSWGPLYKLYTIRTIIHDVLLAYHYPTKRSLNQNIFVNIATSKDIFIC